MLLTKRIVNGVNRTTSEGSCCCTIVCPAFGAGVTAPTTTQHDNNNEASLRRPKLGHCRHTTGTIRGLEWYTCTPPYTCTGTQTVVDGVIPVLCCYARCLEQVPADGRLEWYSAYAVRAES